MSLGAPLRARVPHLVVIRVWKRGRFYTASPVLRRDASLHHKGEEEEEEEERRGWSRQENPRRPCLIGSRSGVIPSKDEAHFTFKLPRVKSFIALNICHFFVCIIHLENAHF